MAAAAAAAADGSDFTLAVRSVQVVSPIGRVYYGKARTGTTSVRFPGSANIIKKDIKAGESLPLSYRLYVAETPMPPREEMNLRYAAFTNPPEASVVK